VRLLNPAVDDSQAITLIVRAFDAETDSRRSA
jgi:hypothetical protein